MPAVPVDDHNALYEELAGLRALNLLEGDELDAFERHAATCKRCQLMVRLDGEALARLALAVPDMDPSPDFKARLMRRAADELQATPPASSPPPAAQPQPRPAAAPSQIRPPSDEPIRLQPRAAPARPVPLWRRSRALSSLAAVLVVGLLSLGTFAYLNQPIASYPLTGGTGSAQVIIRRSGSAELNMQAVPDPPPGFVYEAWVIPPGKQPVAAGTTARGTASVPLPGDVRGATVAVTREQSRVDAPTSPPLMAGVVQS